MAVGVRQNYGCEDLDQIFCYFMRTVLRLQKNGVEELPVEFEGEEPVKGFLQLCTKLLIEGEPPETTELILQSEYDYVLCKYNMSLKQIMEILLIKNLSWHIHFDDNYFDYLLSTSNLWQDRANEYACRTLYANLPLEIQKREGYDKILSLLPNEMLEPDNY